MRDLNVLETEFVLLSAIAGQAVLAEGPSGTRAFGWHTLTLSIKVSSRLFFLLIAHFKGYLWILISDLSTDSRAVSVVL